MARHRWSFIAAVVGCAVALVPTSPAAAQSGIVGGTVYRDTSNHPLKDVAVTIEAANRRTVTDSAGDFRFSGLAAGRYAVVFRHLGFAPLVDTVVVADDAPVDREYVLAEQAVALDSVQVSARQPRKVSSRYNEFLERLKNHNGGYFLTDSVLRINESRKFQDVLTSTIPGLHWYRPDPNTQPTAEYLSSGRGTCDKPIFSCGGGDIPCPVVLFVDGISRFIPNGGASTSDSSSTYNPAPDLSTFNTIDYAGVEYYSGDASAPPRYHVVNNTCGILLLWTREQ